MQADGKILAGGDFTTVAPNGGAPLTRNRIARLERDGLLDRTLDLAHRGTSFSPPRSSLTARLLSAALFTSVLGVARNNIARLNADGTLDTAFNPNANSSIFSIAVQPDGKILAGGIFTNIGGQPRTGIARLDPVTGLADSFNPNANGNVHSVVLQADGKILAGGDFTDDRRATAQPHRPARCDHRPGRFF